jgi:hypothetical protein
MADHPQQHGTASELARQGATKAHDVASWLEGREPGDVVEELKRFARQRPGTFLALAAVAGLVAGRLTRGVKDAASGDDSSSSAPKLDPAVSLNGDATYNPSASATPMPTLDSGDLPHPFTVGGEAR